MSSPRVRDTAGTAIILSASTEPGQPDVATASLAPGAVIGVSDIASLRNPLDVPMLVDEILFNIGALEDGEYISGLGYEEDIRLTMKLDSDKLVREYTPLILLGAQRNLSVNSWSAALTNPPGGPTLLPPQLNAPLFSMPLTSELLLYPGEFLTPNFYPAGQLGSQSVSVRMLVKGRAMKADARRQTLPWISSWVGVLNTPTGGSVAPWVYPTTTEETTEVDLYNPYDVPVYVDRMMGVVASTSAAGFGQYFDPYTADAGLGAALIRMVDEGGRPILRDFTPFSHLFHMSDYSLKLKASMPPHSFWKAYLQENYSTLVAAGETAPSLQLMMSIIGKREVRG